jgi:hypothetical protein
LILRRTASRPPPEDESLEWQGVCVVEAYGPSRVRGLLEGVERLGWNRKQLGDVRDSTLGEWIVRSRGSSLGAGFSPITLTRERPRFGGAGSYQAPLPPGIDHARGFVLAPTPALTVFVLFCVFEDVPAGAIEVILRETFQTEQERFDTGWRTHTAANRKLDALRAERQRLRECAGDFLRSHLPGAFTLDLERELPACEVVTTTIRRPFERSKADLRTLHHPFWMLGFDHETGAWRSEDMAGFSLHLPNGFSRSPALVLAGRHDEVFAGIDSSYGGGDRERFANYLHLRLYGLVALWASYQLLRGYHAVLASARDLERSTAKRL